MLRATSSPQLGRHSVRAVVSLLLVTTFAGCVNPLKWPTREPLKPAPEAADSTGDTDSASDTDKPAPPSDLFVSDMWTMTVGDTPTPSRGWGWRNGTLETAGAHTAGREAWLAALADSRIVARGNAAILLAREHDAAGLKTLDEIIRAASLRVAMRRAALEALASLASPESDELLRSLADEMIAEETAPELHADYVKAWGGRVGPAKHPLFLAAAKHPSPDVRLAAVHVWSDARDTELPREIVALRTDSDSRVRAAAMTALATRNHPQALQWLRTGLNDTQLDVRLESVRALGRLDSAEAAEQVDKLAHDDSESVRAAAVEALALRQDWKSIGKMATDENWRVRVAVIHATATMPQETRRELAKRLMADRSSEVQKALLAVLADWPLDEAGPLLLLAMDRGGYRTRTMAGEQLAERWPPAVEFVADLPDDEHRRQIAELNRQWTARAQKSPPTTERR